LASAGRTLDDIAYIVSTGYGRRKLDFADRTVTEISCHAKGANYLFPKARTVIDIGGNIHKAVHYDQNGNLLDVIQKDFILYERAMGFPPKLIVYKYILRNAVISTVTQIGLLFGLLLAGAVVIETVFDWPGLGLYAYQSIVLSDYQAILAHYYPGTALARRVVR
jgi:ABC-type microcin C transport system permease subunit YejB